MSDRLMTRREVLVAAAGAVLTLPRALRAKASQPSTPVNFAMPAGACDCHTHIHGDPQRFPFYSGRVYTPETALPEEMTTLHAALKVQRVVIVTPSVYGTDNSATLYGMRARGADARGVAVIDASTPERALDEMHRAGVRGIRLNLATAGINDPSAGRQRLQDAIARVSRRNWHVQINTNLAMIAAIKDMVVGASVPIVFDHFGGAQAQLGVEQPGFADLIELVRSGRAYVKISGAYRSSTGAPDYADVVPLARALIAANPDRVVWGTDWPHPNLKSHMPDDGKLVDLIPSIAPSPELRRALLVDNPMRLYWSRQESR